jgi:hypothetical protein
MWLSVTQSGVEVWASELWLCMYTLLVLCLALAGAASSTLIGLSGPPALQCVPLCIALASFYPVRRAAAAPQSRLAVVNTVLMFSHAQAVTARPAELLGQLS